MAGLKVVIGTPFQAGGAEELKGSFDFADLFATLSGLLRSG